VESIELWGGWKWIRDQLSSLCSWSYQPHGMLGGFGISVLVSHFYFVILFYFRIDNLHWICSHSSTCCWFPYTRLIWLVTWCVSGRHCDTFRRRSAGAQWVQSSQWLPCPSPLHTFSPSVHSRRDITLMQCLIDCRIDWFYKLTDLVSFFAWCIVFTKRVAMVSVIVAAVL